MTLREHMEIGLSQLYVPSSQAVECMQYVMETLEENNIFKEWVYIDDLWTQPITRFSIRDMHFVFHQFVLPEAFKWLADLHYHQN